MLTWLSQNIGTIIVLLVVVLIVAAIVKSMRREKRQVLLRRQLRGLPRRLHARTEVKTARPPLTLNMEAAPIGVLCSVLPLPPERRAQLGNRLCPFCVL